MTTPSPAVPDTVLTVAVGRNYFTTGEPMSDILWSAFRGQLCAILERHATVVAYSSGVGITSDGPNASQREDTYVLVAINPRTDLDEVRPLVANLLADYGQASACFAVDHLHAPVFSIDTTQPAQSVTAATYAPTHGGYPDA